MAKTRTRTRTRITTGGGGVTAGQAQALIDYLLPPDDAPALPLPLPPDDAPADTPELAKMRKCPLAAMMRRG